jgi:four helix bundle protein
MAFKFEGLRVGQMAIDLSVTTHQLTLKFPKEELYVLTSQMKGSADSVALNIAEGSQEQPNAEQNKFLGNALRSAIELVCCLHLCYLSRDNQSKRLRYYTRTTNHSNKIYSSF